MNNTLAMTGFIRLFGGSKHVENKKTCPVISTVKSLRLNDCMSFRRLGGKAILSSNEDTSINPVMSDCYTYLITEHEKL